MTSRLSVSYSLLHCFLSCASEGFCCPFGTGVFDLAATHFSKSGGSGTAAAPPCCWDWPRTARSTHLSNSSWVIFESPTVATAPAGTLLPQPVRARRPVTTARTAIRGSVKARVMAKAAAKGSERVRRELKVRLLGRWPLRESPPQR